MTLLTALIKNFALPADAVANASGLGFNGYDELGKPKWDLVSNVDIIEFEV